MYWFGCFPIYIFLSIIRCDQLNIYHVSHFLYTWQTCQDSNLNLKLQRLLCYRYTTSLNFWSQCRESNPNFIRTKDAFCLLNYIGFLSFHSLLKKLAICTGVEPVASDRQSPMLPLHQQTVYQRSIVKSLLVFT